MSIDRPIAFPLKLLLIPSLAGLVAWGITAKAHQGLDLASSLIVLSTAVVLATALLELFAVPIGIRRLLSAPQLRTLGNFLAVALAGAFLLFQFVLVLVGFR